MKAVAGPTTSRDIDILTLMRTAHEQQLAELQDKKDNFIRAFAEQVVVDFGQVIEKAETLEDLGEEVVAEAYQLFFYSFWLEGLPSAYRRIFQKALLEDNETMLEVKAYVSGMGAKLKVVRTGLLCVSTTAPPDCQKCYFKEVCEVRRLA